MKTFRIFLNEGKETNATVAKHVSKFLDIVASGPRGEMSTWHYHELKQHAKSVKPEHAEIVHQKLEKEMEDIGSFTDNEKKEVSKIFKPKRLP